MKDSACARAEKTSGFLSSFSFKMLEAVMYLIAEGGCSKEEDAGGLDILLGLSHPGRERGYHYHGGRDSCGGCEVSVVTQVEGVKWKGRG